MSGRAFMPLLFRIASKAGSYGIRLIAATTSPKATIVDTTLRGQFGLRLAFRCEEESHSEAAFGLGKRDAARLPNIPGRFLAQLPGQQDLVLAQAYHVDDEMLSRVTDGLRTKYGSAPTAIGQGAVTDHDREIALYCLEANNGYFVSTAIAKQFHIHPSQVAKLAAEWDERHWLQKAEGARGYIAQPLRDAVGWAETPVKSV
jgi:DNA segregation ATPase FtsK/SpoIIIE-like protein